MDHEAGLLSLPVEVLQHTIGSFLAVKDILACSACCHYLRAVFNTNTTWKKYLPGNLVVSDLLSVEPCVEPKYSSEGTLTPLCENRVAYIQKLNLINNWRDGKYVKHSRNMVAANKKELSRRRLEELTTYKANYIFFGQFFNNSFCDSIGLWDMRKELTLVTQINMEERYQRFFTIADHLVVVKSEKARVYKIDLPSKKLPFLFSFLIDEISVAFNVNLPLRDEPKRDWNYCVNEQFLIANKTAQDQSPSEFHVWDIANACKVGSFTPPMVGFGFQYISNCDGKWLLRIAKNPRGFGYYFLEFDVQKKSFSEKVLLVYNRILHSMVDKSYMVTFEVTETAGNGRTMSRVYDLGRSEVVVERCFNGLNSSELRHAKIINDTFVIMYDEQFLVYDSRTLDTLRVFPCIGARYMKKQVDLAGTLFVFTVSSRDKIQIWDVNEQCSRVVKEIRMEGIRRFCLNKSNTKLVRYNHTQIEVYHFL